MTALSLTRRVAVLVATLSALIAGGTIAGTPPASAGCVYGGGFISKCDGPVQPDGTWQRCVAVAALVPRGASSFLAPEKHCDVLGPDLGSGDPPGHIDD